MFVRDILAFNAAYGMVMPYIVTGYMMKDFQCAIIEQNHSRGVSGACRLEMAMLHFLLMLNPLPHFSYLSEIVSNVNICVGNCIFNNSTREPIIFQGEAAREQEAELRGLFGEEQLGQLCEYQLFRNRYIIDLDRIMADRKRRKPVPRTPLEAKVVHATEGLLNTLTELFCKSGGPHLDVQIDNLI